ncbi:hypothetical protein BZA77DRAFT_242942 [Pyronema omphalodes]|nr:hypothetical protein BZA77DRAFT_242942 [Pyronema omphalodes]
MQVPTTTITLTPDEETVRQLLVDVSAVIDSENNNGDEPLVLRFTGGWVRDKLLGIECHDIDVGINKMTGFNFATRLGQFLEENQNKYNIPARSIHKIESNPEKSKHLETATTKILGLDMDFVNLRSETYTEESRIPQMEFGTPVQDALRRDACVNALFYNIHTQKVEDFTKRGLEDMQLKVLRTPLAPYETFHDDPLRVLRLIRFSSRLGFKIVEEARKAMETEEIRRALRLKISRERVGVEVEKMLQGPHPFDALCTIYELKLFPAIFTPPIDNLPDLPQDDMIEACDIVNQIIASTSFLGNLVSNPQEKYVAWILAALTPWKDHMFPGTDTKKRIPAAATAGRDGLKLPTKIVTTVTNSFRNYQLIQDTVNGEKLTRAQAGMLIRKLGADWKSQYLLSLLLETIPVWKRESEMTEEAKAIWSKYEEVLKQWFDDMGLEEAFAFRPVLNGAELMAVLEQKKAGPWMMTALNALMEWQLENTEVGKETADEATKEKAKEWARENKDKLLVL